jgi:NADPH-dependent 2,4-dienoyl-CoA reductase/sulfur reductase-like enzyme/peroxiredoxin family protein/rhodanese-related sulfurtransferase/TusA-related sulfurtransferase
MSDIDKSISSGGFMSKILIVGGVAGGASAAARLRRLDEKAQIIMFEKGEYISYANCGLPYYVGGVITDKKALTVQTPESFKTRFNIDVRILSEVTKIDTKNKKVTVKNLKNGEEYTENYDKLIISSGANPIKPNIEGIDSKKVFTLKTIPDAYAIKDFVDNNKPGRAVIIGGGYIGLEMAENLYNAGIDVTVVEFADHLIAALDFDTACELHNYLRRKGIGLLLKEKVEKIEEKDGNIKIITSNTSFETDMVVISVGVRPESGIASAAGIEVNQRGEIITDERMRTSDRDVYAVGDAIEVTEFVSEEKRFIPLAGPANKQGRIAADNICGIDSVYKGTQGTAILKFMDMTVAMTGLTENICKKLGIEYEKSYTYSASHATYYPGAVNMAVKIIFSKKDGKLLGAQITGFEGVDKRIDVLATAIRANMTIFDLTGLELAYAPPFSSAKDPVNMAGYVAENIITKKMKIFHWHDVKNLPRDGSLNLLDVRTETEFEGGAIEGFINIPLDSLRNNLDKIDKNKPVYLYCQIGLRGYIACRLLEGYGYNCYNLSGGYRLYNSIFSEAKPQERIMNVETMLPEEKKRVSLDACGLQCPGPILKLSQALKEAHEGDILEVSATDPGFASDAESWCGRTGNIFGGVTEEKGIYKVIIQKGVGENKVISRGNNKNIIVFSGDLDKAIASFIIANAAASMGRKVSMFFTFWGLNILRKPEKVRVKKGFLSKMFGMMMPRGAEKLKISKMNMGGIGTKMIKGVMKSRNIDSIEDMIKKAQQNGVELIACAMSMDVMGIKKEELIDGVKTGGAAMMLANAEESDMSLFI